MFNTDQIHRIIREAALQLRHPIDSMPEGLHRTYAEEELVEFRRDLTEAGNQKNILFLEYTLARENFIELLGKLEWPILFIQKEDGLSSPAMLIREGKKITMLTFYESETRQRDADSGSLLPGDTEEISFYAMVAYDPLVGSASPGEEPQQAISPLRRLFQLLRAEKKDIFYILFYAVVVGLIGLIIPLGIQTTVELVSGGVFFSSIYILIGLIILGVLFTGGIQIFQITMVEYLQRRIFTKAAYEFAYRLPRVKNEALVGHYTPELVNRFFDVINLQKGLPKLLIDLSSAALQIFFGLLLISLYHPFFVFFGIVLIGTLILIFLFTGPRALKTSIEESKYKYRVVFWLQELGRALNSFKVAGNTMLPMRKADYNVNNYLKYRKGHFEMLITQFSYIVVFKTLITAALLILGTVLVIDRQITLGQFVASEVIIILILNSVEKFITYMDVIYDMLTAVDKIAHVTDLPLEKVGGIDLPKAVAHMPFSVQMRDVSFQYANNTRKTLQKINLNIEAGERVCISGPGNSGKTSLTQLISGLQPSFEGSITISKFSLRDLDLTNLRDRIAKNISAGDIFDGTLLDNITLGKTTITPEAVVDALEKVGLTNWVNQLPDGLNSRLISGGKGLSSTHIQKLVLARCLAKGPSMLILNEFFAPLSRTDKLKLLEMLTRRDNKFTLIAVSNDPLVMAACDRVVLMKEGGVEAAAPFDELIAKGLITDNLD
ncbi:MAG: peptidase domain-containing ABC transporter [Bacteroidota bacterium]